MRPMHSLVFAFILFLTLAFLGNRQQSTIALELEHEAHHHHHHWNVDDWLLRNLQEDGANVGARSAQYSLEEQINDDLDNQRLRSAALQFAESRRATILDTNRAHLRRQRNVTKDAKSSCSGKNCQIVTARMARARKFKKDSQTNVPRSSVRSIRNTFHDYFSTERNYENDQQDYIRIKRSLRDKFQELGLFTFVQKFPAKTKPFKRERKPRQYRTHGHNIIGILPGQYRQRDEDKDSVIVIGAHMDTVPTSPGVDDNGSGSVVVLELARLLTRHQCQLNTTIIFVLFDLEEYGVFGSKNFVRNYLLHKEDPSKVKAVLIMDMILEYDQRPNVQSSVPFDKIIPNFEEAMEQNSHRGNFLGAWARDNIDTPFFEHLRRNWMNAQTYKLYLMAARLPLTGRELNQGFLKGNLKKHGVLLRSDHASFWYPDFYKNITIPNTILLTDLGPWRKNIVDKYHNAHDNSTLLTSDNLNFLRNTIDSILVTVLDISDGKCQQV